MQLQQTDATQRQLIKLIKASVVPRPIAWVSTRSNKGTLNIAPYSFFTVAALQPVTLCFSVGPDHRGANYKDTLANIKATHDFVIQTVAEPQAQAMHATSNGLMPEVSEFEEAGLTAEKAAMVQSPRVQGAPVHFECRLDRIIPVGENTMVLGTLACLHVDDAVLDENGYIDYQKLQPVGRMAGDYCYVRDFFAL